MKYQILRIESRRLLGTNFTEIWLSNYQMIILLILVYNGWKLHKGPTRISTQIWTIWIWIELKCLKSFVKLLHTYELIGEWMLFEWLIMHERIYWNCLMLLKKHWFTISMIGKASLNCRHYSMFYIGVLHFDKIWTSVPSIEYWPKGSDKVKYDQCVWISVWMWYCVFCYEYFIVCLSVIVFKLRQV